MRSLKFNVHDIKLGDKTIIEQCAFSVKEGQVAAFIGPSGCGKTTMLNTIAGLLSFEHIQRPRIDTLSYIFQEPRLIPWLTIKQNVLLVNPKLTDYQCEHLLSQVDLHGCMEAFPNQLSGGMQKRVSIARAFARPPSLLLLDEPFSSLDNPTAAALYALLLSLIERYNTAALLVTHDLSEAIALADDLFFLSSQPMNIIHHRAIELCKSQRTSDVIQSISDELHSSRPDLLGGKA